jgi:hypothetical protein
MKYTLNGSIINLRKDIVTEESLNTMIKEIDSSYNSCSKAIETYNLVSDVKAIESFGYIATEGLSESIKNGAKAVWENIKEFFKKISSFTNKLITDFIMKISFPKTKNGDVANKTKTVLSNASKHVYDASIKIIKKISSSVIYNNNDELKRYQKLELTANSLTKIIREDARTLASISKKTNQKNDISFEHVIVEKFLDKVTDCIVHTEQMCKLFYDECENSQFDIPKIDKLYKLTEYWLNQVKSSFEEFNENIKNIAEQKTVNDNDFNANINKEIKNYVSAKNIEGIRADLWIYIGIDPNFTKDFIENLNYCLRNGISESELYENHDNRHMSDEVTNDNFAKLCDQLRINFSKERLEKIKEIGRKLYPIK